jgi:dienelactone hydrolase
MSAGAAVEVGPGVVEEHLAVERDGLALQGTLARPAAQGATPHGVLALHGWGGVRAGPHRLFVLLARELAGRGVPVLRFDHAGRGVSGGEATAATLDGMIADAQAAAAALCARTGAAAVAAVGICSGGNVALGAAGLAPERLRRCVCVSTLPFAAPDAGRSRQKAWGLLRQYARKALSPATWRRVLRGEASLRRAGRVVENALQESAAERARKNSARDLPAALAGYDGALHFLYGGGDPEAPAARAYYEALAARHGLAAGFEVIPGANHNFYSLPWAAALRERIRAAVLA